MTRRKMVRAEYDERVRLQAALAGELSAIVRSVHPGLTLHLVSDAPTLLALGKFQELADSTVINRAAFARELADWLLENDSDRAVGMRGREFGLSDAAAARFRAGLAGTGPLLPDETVAFAKSGNLGYSLVERGCGNHRRERRPRAPSRRWAGVRDDGAAPHARRLLRRDARGDHGSGSA